jgi:peptidoglycan/xylan/chitin deacetylase (PgdA/CDA1 family)
VDDSGSYVSIAISHFRACMERLAERGYKGVTMAEASEQIRAGSVPERVAVLTFDDGLTSFGEQAWPLMREYGHRGTLFVPVDYVGGVSAWYKDYGLPPMRTHTWDELRKLRDEGADIQSHGCRHPKLSTVDAAVLREELARSREVLERELAMTIEHFCYPFGDYDEAVIAAARACGYATAVTTDPGWWRPDSDRLAIPRDCLDVVNLHDSAFSKRVIDACLDGSFSRYVRIRDRLRAAVGMSWEPPRGK